MKFSTGHVIDICHNSAKFDAMSTWNVYEQTNCLHNIIIYTDYNFIVINIIISVVFVVVWVLLL